METPSAAGSCHHAHVFPGGPRCRGDGVPGAQIAGATHAWLAAVVFCPEIPALADFLARCSSVKSRLRLFADWFSAWIVWPPEPFEDETVGFVHAKRQGTSLGSSQMCPSNKKKMFATQGACPSKVRDGEFAFRAMPIDSMITSESPPIGMTTFCRSPTSITRSKMMSAFQSEPSPPAARKSTPTKVTAAMAAAATAAPDIHRQRLLLS